ncbi:hypothetical protein Y032_0004g2147 [Ancylostoma ceylanicum]|uniref:Major facilitator superfamily (MFS) profile domain-containing protein n=1 Tax=Ancylostoma ceylanicum TaxID=53326 RepID=A0A016VXD1_9BILA|nr:hypothetical protein Y032_0004g2147 [Ancylostoma ceylanicum]
MAVGWAFSAEMISPKHRFKLRAFTSWTNGRLLMVAITHIGGTWRLSTYLHAAATLLPLAIVFFLPEVPMWLKKKEYYEREEEARKKLDWINGLEPKEESASKEEEKEKLLKQQKVVRISFIRALRNKELRTNFLTLFVMWFCAGLTTYCIDLNGEDMTKNLWLGQYMTSLLASVLRVLVGFADAKYKWLGRRKLFIMAIGTCTLASIALFVELIVGMKGQLIYFATYLIAYNAVAVHWEPCYMGAAELIPTEVRATSTAFLNVISRVANVLAARSVCTEVLPVVMMFRSLERSNCSRDEDGSRSDRGSMQGKESKESSRSGSKEIKDVEREGDAPGSRESVEGSDEHGKVASGSRDSVEAKQDGGSALESGRSERKGSDSAEPAEERR